MDVDCIVGKPVVELRIPRVLQKTTKHSPQSGYNIKRNYTEQELAAATSDICSGKIGTRRASMLYGIPRSTLRNKIFRLKSDVLPDIRDFVTGGQTVRRHPDAFQGVETIKTECSAMMDSGHDVVDQLVESRLALGHCQGPYKVVVPPMTPSTSEPVQSYCFEREEEPTDPVMDQKLSFLQRLIQEFTEKQMKAEIEEHRRYFGVDFRLKSVKASDGFHPGYGSCVPELKVPFYRPVRSTERGTDDGDPTPGLYSWDSQGLVTPMSSRSTRINSVLNDVITKTISEKFHSRIFDSPFTAFRADAFGPSDVGLGSSSSSSSSEALVKHPRSQLLTALRVTTTSSPDFETSLADSRSTSGSSDGEKKMSRAEKMSAKKTRPKRGQYRKYNRQLLLEAVKAVQKGDMSVHRAGSYYGVPHSTLEYKVKERHLLRQKKALENTRTIEPVLTGSGQNETNNTSGPAAALGVPSRGGSSSDSSSTKTIRQSKVMLLFGKETTAKKTTRRPPPITPYPFRYPHEDGLMSSASSLSSVTPLSLPLPVSCFRGALPIGFGWPPLMAGLFPLTSPVPTGPLFDAQVPPSFGFSMSASELLKRLQQKVQASLSGHEASREQTPELGSIDNRAPTLSPEITSGRSSTCSIGSPQVAVS